MSGFDIRGCSTIGGVWQRRCEGKCERQAGGDVARGGSHVQAVQAVQAECTPSVGLEIAERHVTCGERARRGECIECIECRVHGSPHTILCVVVSVVVMSCISIHSIHSIHSPLKNAVRCAKSERTLHELYTKLQNYTRRGCMVYRGMQEGEEV